MMKRNNKGSNRKRRLTLTRKKGHTTPDLGDGPTEEAFRNMRPACAIVVPVEVKMSDTESADDNDTATSTGGGHRSREMFRKGDDVILHSARDGTENVWVARILQIREDANGHQWARVAWYWSRDDLSKWITTFDSSGYAPFERAFSDMTNIVSCHSFVRVVNVHCYDDGQLDPPEIGPTDFFWRSYLRHKRKFVDPKIGMYTCLVCCTQTYNPFPDWRAAPNATLNTMHFCPRPNCATWFHYSCLLSGGFTDNPSVPFLGDRGVRLLGTDPDFDFPCPLLATFCEKAPEDDTHILQFSPSHIPLSLTDVLSMDNRENLLAHLPASLVSVAQSPIIRRPGPAADGWSPVGNVSEVVLARRFIYAAFEGICAGNWPSEVTKLIMQAEAMERGEQLADFMWIDDEDDHSGEMVVEDGDDDKHVKELETVCDKLASLLLLASPYPSYWEHRQQELEVETWMDSPPFYCPKCKGAI